MPVQHVRKTLIRSNNDIANSKGKDRRPENVTLAHARRAKQILNDTQEFADFTIKE
jgi:hypothetical protein